jgi:cleavage stimulation factor subunit 3
MLLFCRETYEELVQVFPTSGKFWKHYIEHEMRMRNYERVEKLFQRCLIRYGNLLFSESL